MTCRCCCCRGQEEEPAENPVMPDENKGPPDRTGIEFEELMPEWACWSVTGIMFTIALAGIILAFVIIL